MDVNDRRFLMKRRHANRYSCVVEVKREAGDSLFEGVDSILDGGARAGCERRCSA